MFAPLTTMEAATLLEQFINAAEASGAYYPSDDFAREGTLGHELHELRMEVREVYLRKYFEARCERTPIHDELAAEFAVREASEVIRNARPRYVPLYGAVD